MEEVRPREEPESLIVLPHGQAIPEWAERVDARPVPAAELERDDAAVTLGRAGCVILPAAASGFVATARRVHALDAAIQVIAVAPPESAQAVRRALLYAPGLGEVWIASPAELAEGGMQGRAVGVTRQRRRFERTRARIEREQISTSPQRAERALISDAYLAGLLLVLPDAVFSVDASGRVLSANATAERMFATSEGLIGERLGSVLRLPESHGGDDAALLRRASQDSHLEVAFALASGDNRVGELRAAVLEEQGLAIWAVVLRDVTEQHEMVERIRDTASELEASNEELQSTTEELMERTAEAENAVAALRESESSFRALADAIPTLAWTARPDGFIDWYNRRWYEYTGMTPAQIVGWGWRSVHDPAVLPSVEERWTDSIRTGTPFEMTFPLRGADGRFRAFLTRVVPVRDGEGRIVRWFGTNTDVEAEHASRRRIERLQSLTEALAATRTLGDVAEVVVENAAAATGARSAMLMIRPPGTEDAVVVKQRGLTEEFVERLRQSPSSGPGPAAESLRTGRPIFVEGRAGPEGLLTRFAELESIWEALGTHAAAAVPLVAGGETVGSMSFTFTEPKTFTPDDRAFYMALARQGAQAVERARLFEAERDARARADEANQAKSHFLANMSHELRTPLNAIGGHIQLVELGLHGPVTDAQREALGRVRRAQEHLLGLINDVLNFAKLESGRTEFDLEAIDIQDVFADVAPLMTPQFETRGVAFSAGIEAGDAPSLRVCADRDKVRQVLLNLLSNAVKFTDAGGEVRLEAVPFDQDHVAIHVRDTGRGIPSDRLEAIFEPFVQVRAQYGTPHEGTGLGLAISRDLAHGMGGRLTAESRLGAGSTFTLMLPAV